MYVQRSHLSCNSSIISPNVIDGIINALKLEIKKLQNKMKKSTGIITLLLTLVITAGLIFTAAVGVGEKEAGAGRQWLTSMDGDFFRSDESFVMFLRTFVFNV